MEYCCEQFKVSCEMEVIRKVKTIMNIDGKNVFKYFFCLYKDDKNPTGFAMNACPYCVTNIEEHYFL